MKKKEHKRAAKIINFYERKKKRFNLSGGFNQKYIILYIRFNS